MQKIKKRKVDVKMKVLTIILGALIAIAGVSCLFTPVVTYIETQMFLAVIAGVMMLIYGITGIARAVRSKEYGVNFLFGILSVIAGIIVLFAPGSRLFLTSFALYVAAAWFILQGFSTIFLALNAKRVVNGSRWIWGIVIGVLGVLLGIYSFVHPLVLAGAAGLLISFYLIETGINMIVLAAQSE